MTAKRLEQDVKDAKVCEIHCWRHLFSDKNHCLMEGSSASGETKDLM